MKEAVARARQRREEATGIREALEAEAQQVAQLAVEAESAFNKVKKQLDDATQALKEAKTAEEILRLATYDIQNFMTDAADASSANGANIDVEASLDFVSERPLDAAEGSAEESDEVPLDSLEDILWSKTQELEMASNRVAELEAKITALQTKFVTVEENYKKADSIAAAAMEAAEEAVRDEMDFITVANETESALVKAMEDLRFLENSSDRREEVFDRKAKGVVGAAAAMTASAAASGVAGTATDDASKKMDEEVAKSAAGLAKIAASTAAAATPTVDASNAEKKGDAAQKSDKPRAVPAVPDVEDPSLAKRSLFDKVYAAMAALRQHRHAIIGGSILIVLAGTWLHQQGAFAILAAKAQSAATMASKLWAIAADLASKLPLPHVHESEQGIMETIWLLLASVITVPLVCKIPGGSPVLGFLAGGALIGPYALGIIQDVESIRHLAELGVVFLLFNIGLELSFDRLRSMQKFVFGMGSAQVVATLAAVAYTASAALGPSLGGPGAVILGGGLALSTTAVGMQVLQDRGETGSRHGRAAFSVLLLQDLAVVVLLMLIPLLAPSPDGAAGGTSSLCWIV